DDWTPVVVVCLLLFALMFACLFLLFVLRSAGCPSWQVYSDCSGSCPYTCEDLWPNTQCLPGPCTPGCTCPSGQV
uniref:TIL domain-containing protein n=1 Tax=Oryzias melastigma TaxID=30732 RepID=A0A3B3B3Y9_ORYME